MKKEFARACQGITCRLLATRTRTIEASPYTPPVVVVDRGCTVFIRFCLPGREESQGQRRLRMGARLVETNADGPCTANFGLDWIGAPQGTISLPRNPSPPTVTLPASLSASVPLHACEGLAVRGALHALVCVPSSSILSAASPWHGGYASFVRSFVRRSFDVGWPFSPRHFVGLGILPTSTTKRKNSIADSPHRFSYIVGTGVDERDDWT